VLVKKENPKNIFVFFRKKPARLVFAIFLAVILLGAVLLYMPFATLPNHRISFFDALFMSVSAACAVGFELVDAGIVFSMQGKMILLFLIQVGGIGLITLSSWVLLSFHRSKSSHGLQNADKGLHFRSAKELFITVLLTTIILELIGAAILSFSFIPRFGVENGLFYSVFYSVSSFCNAGFALSLPDIDPSGAYYLWNQEPIIVFTLSFLSIAGGLGFIVWKDIFSLPKKKQLQMHTKVILFGTLFLLLAGLFFFFLVEGGMPAKSGFQEMSLGDKWTSSFFLSATARTTGFHSAWISELQTASKLFLIFLMFVGGGPGSTAGGVKISNFSLLLHAVFSDLFQKNEIVMHKRRVGKDMVRRALVLFSVALLMTFTVSFFLVLSEKQALSEGRFTYLDLFFEAVSAYSSVGLSTIETLQLTSLSRTFLIPAMLVGRTMPVILALFLSMKTKKEDKNIYPDVHIQLG